MRTNEGEKHSRSRAARRLFVAAVGGGVLAFLTAIPTAASADNGGHTCGVDDVCVYNNSNFDTSGNDVYFLLTPWSVFEGNYSNMHQFPEPHTYNNPESCNQYNALQRQCNLNDTISSVKNTSTYRSVRVYDNANYSGGYQTVYIGGRIAQVKYNDQISSECWNYKATVSPCKFSN